MAQNSPEEPNGEMAELLDLLLRLGASESEARAAITQTTGGGFALELNLRSEPPLTLAAAAAAAGLEETDFLRLWHAFGLATPPPETATIPHDVVAAVPVIGQAAIAWLGEESALGIARVLGSSSARIAEALVDAFRTGFEVPQLSAGKSYVAVVEEYLDLTDAALPLFLNLLTAVIKAHLVKVASSAWTPDAENQAARRDLLVGFVDLVGYTALSRTLRPRELASLLGQFEDLVADVVTSGGGRLVKLIGDGAMFVCDTQAAGCRIALALSERFALVESLPPARVGADYGSVLSLYGDYFGDVVNRAARLVALANPGTVVVSERAAQGLDEKFFGLEQLPEQALKGFQAPAVSYRLLAR